METKFTNVRSILLAAGVVAAMTSGPLSAASACKGLDNSACTSNASCSWVAGYQRKDGRNVKSFCRTKPASAKKVTETSKPAKAGKAG